MTRIRIGLAVGVLVLAGCAGQDGSGVRTDDVAATTKSIARSPTSDVDTATTFEDVLAETAEMYGIEDPPQVKPVREITPVESKDVLDACLVERGWPMTRGGFQIPAEQEEALNLDSYICTAMYPIREEYLQPLDDAAWSRIYHYWVDTTVPCLQGQGLVVPDPPSEETFLASRAWTPDGDQVREQVADRVAQGDFTDVESVFIEVCPVSPPPEVRLGP